MLKKGEVVWVQLEGKGSVQKGLRPSIVVSNDIGNKHSPVITIIPLTTHQGKKLLPTHVKIKKQDFKEGGNFKDSVALVEQMRVVDKKSVVRKGKTSISNDTSTELYKAIVVSLGM